MVCSQQKSIAVLGFCSWKIVVSYAILGACDKSGYPQTWSNMYSWLVVWLPFLAFSHSYLDCLIIPIDELHHFSEGFFPNHQPGILSDLIRGQLILFDQLKASSTRLCQRRLFSNRWGFLLRQHVCRKRRERLWKRPRGRCVEITMFSVIRWKLLWKIRTVMSTLD